MRNLFSAVLLILFFNNAHSQQASYWQQQVNYTINVVLDTSDKSLNGDVSMEYSNLSPDTLHFIWIHLWPNAYKNDRTALSDQLLENGNTGFYFSNDDKRGYINRLNFKVNDETAMTIEHPQHQDIVKLLLPHPLPPSQKIKIETPFHVKLPEYISRSGYIGRSFMITQWYPKPAVYDHKGWHPIPYLDQGEFYSEFGKYNVNITLPRNYTVACTGTLIKTDEQDSSKTLQYQQDNVHDFAWFADKNFEVLHDTLQLPGKTVDVYAYFHSENKKYWGKSISYIKNAIRTKSQWLGEYPYKTASVVEKAGSADGGGMEYPTITLISKTTDEKILDYLINHELGHNWFYGILASNEREHAWMDEGMNSYYDHRYFMQQHGSSSPDFIDGTNKFIANRKPTNLENTLLASIIAIKKDQPIETRSEQFSELNYAMVAYRKTAQWMQLLEEKLGSVLFDSMMHQYYETFKFKHPYPADFKMVAETVSGQNLDSIFNLLSSKGSVHPPVKKDIRITSFFSLKETEKHNYIFIAPAIGYNYYDKFMVGLFLHNYSMPATKFQFFLSPLYATGSKQLNGLGRVAYSWFPGSRGQKMEFALAAGRFTGDSFTDSTGKVNFQPFSKIAPSVKFTFAPKNPRSTVTKFIQFKTFFIRETGLLFKRDDSTGEEFITYPKESRTLNQLQFVIDNNRVLYPYDAALQVEQGDGFVRTNVTANYFFNYAKGGGMNLRLFAGKFMYTADKTFSTQYKTDRYHLNMTGPKGYEDYNYNNYFIGRNEFEGFSNQQIMIRDGAFKVRTDLLSSKIGKTDNWLAALNFTSTVPKNINPLSVLPFKIPVKVFADIGTYADAWEKDAGTSRFLYDAGFQLSLLRNTVNIYFPVLYSKVYKDYFKSTITEKRFIKNISFSIDLQNATLKKLFPQLSF